MLEKNDLMDFSILSWYPLFKEVSMKTSFVYIPVEVVEKIREIGLDIIDTISSSISMQPFYQDLRNALQNLNNEAFVKNNWHAPLDAKMFSLGNSLKVTNVRDLLLYLIASDKVLNDFCHESVQYCIALRPWTSIHPASEFRCIIANKVLRGITPRDWPTFYPHFKEEGALIIDSIRNFYEEKIKLLFNKNNYTLDIVIPYPGQEPYVMDFGPLNSKSNLYAFSWKEIAPLTKQRPSGGDIDIAPVFRFLESDIGIMTRESALQLFSTGN